MPAAVPPAHSIVGREAELDRLRTLLTGDSRPAVVFIEGDAGLGKTALLEAAVPQLAGVGTRVLWARPAEAETAGSFAALGDLLRPLVGGLPALPEPQRRALAAAMWLEVAERPVDPRVVGLACLSLLDGVGGAVLIAVDDWQWLDAASATALSFVLRRLRPGGARAIATARSGEHDAVLARLVRSLPPGQAAELTLGPLDPTSVARLVHERTGTWLAPPKVAGLHRACGGNPLLALELVRASGAHAATDIRRLLAARLAALAPATRSLLRYAAATSGPTPALLERAIGDEAMAANGLEEALAADVIVVENGRLRFTHPLLAEAVAERTPPGEWRAVHARLAKLVDNPEERCRHLAAAATGPDQHLADLLEAAAEQAKARGALASAGELAELAAHLTPASDEAAQRRRVTFAADAHDRSGDGRRARALLEKVVDGAPPGPLRAAALYRLAYMGDFRTGAERAARALEEPGVDDALRAEIHCCLAGMTVLSGDSPAALRHAELAMRHAELAANPESLVEAIQNLAYMRWVTEGGVQRDDLERAVELERRGELSMRDASSKEFLAMQLLAAGELSGARELLEPELERAVCAGDLQHEAQALRLLVEVELRAGRWRLADEYADRALETTLGAERWNAEGCGRWARAIADAHMGRTESAREHAEAGLAVSRDLDDVAWSARCSHVLGFLALSLGDSAAAVMHLGPLRALEERLGAAEPGRFGFGPDVAEALVLTGDLAGGRTAERHLDERGRALGRPWAIATGLRCRGLIAAVDGDLETALAALDEALTVHSEVRQPFERARTLLVRGTVQRRAKRRGEARSSLEAALAVFQELGAPLWAEKARAEIARLGGRRAQDCDELTETERRIAELAASGRSNREIAGELFVSERTVESNLTRAYRKLGVRSRTELARRLPVS